MLSIYGKILFHRLNWWCLYVLNRFFLLFCLLAWFCVFLLLFIWVWKRNFWSFRNIPVLSVVGGLVHPVYHDSIRCNIHFPICSIRAWTVYVVLSSLIWLLLFIFIQIWNRNFEVFEISHTYTYTYAHIHTRIHMRVLACARVRARFIILKNFLFLFFIYFFSYFFKF